MNRTKTLASTLSLVALAYACTDKPTPSATDVVVPEPPQAISDALHSGGNSGFFFLPPMVPDPAHDGTFAAALSPVVRICEWAGTECVLPFLAEFTTETGPGSETVRLSTEDEHYIVSWHTDEFELDPAFLYRIQVSVAGTELGFADVDVVSGGRELKNVQTGAFIPLLNGRTLPIKFRIEEGAVLSVTADIVFNSNRDGNQEIYAIRPDGSGLTNLTNNADFDVRPVWSPDGTQILFRRGDGSAEVYVMNADGTQQVNLTNRGGSDLNAAWSPDGSRIAFRAGSGPQAEIWVMDADGSDQTKLTNNSAADFEPVWSADGTKIAFQSQRDGNTEIYIVNVDGSGEMNLTNDPGHDRAPQWSRDGTRIAFHSDRGVGGTHIYVMNADGSGQTRLTSGRKPVWSPDATQIAFGSFLMNADGTDVTPFALGGGGEPSWSPDGARLVYHSTQDGGLAEIYVSNADGSGETRLTNNSAYDFGARWGGVPPPITNSAPTVTITAPADNSAFNPGELVSLAGAGSDPEDGPLSGADLLWTSDVDGQLGTGSSLVTSTLSVGTHVITLTGSDGQYARGWTSITITVVTPSG